MKHTPGPWIKSDESGICEGMGAWLVMSPGDLRAEGEFIIAGVVDIDQQVWPECGHAEANAKLIAAAPDLLELCQRVVNECEDTFNDPEDMSPEWVKIHRQMKAVIDKATK